MFRKGYNNSDGLLVGVIGLDVQSSDFVGGWSLLVVVVAADVCNILGCILLLEEKVGVVVVGFIVAVAVLVVGLRLGFAQFVAHLIGCLSEKVKERMRVSEVVWC